MLKNSQQRDNIGDFASPKWPRDTAIGCGKQHERRESFAVIAQKACCTSREMLPFHFIISGVTRRPIKALAASCNTRKYSASGRTPWERYVYQSSELKWISDMIFTFRSSTSR